MELVRKAGRFVSAVPDLVFALVAGLVGTFWIVLVSVTTPVRHRPGRRLLVLDAAYSLTALQERDLLHTVQVRDLDGFFEHVWSVHPLTGADPDEPRRSAFGRARITELNDRHTWVEGHQGFATSLVTFPMTNLILAQVSVLGVLIRIARVRDISALRIGDPYYLGLLALLIRLFRRVPLVVRINGNYDAIYNETGRPAYPRLFRYRSVEKRIEQRVLRTADLVVAPNEDNLRFALRNGARADRSSVFRYGNLIHPIHFVDPESPERSEPVVDLSAPLLICVSRLEGVKYVEHFVDLIASLRAEDVDVSGLLVGEGSLRARLLAKVAELGIQEHVSLVGSRSQTWIARALVQSDVVVAPMMGRALVEAALSASPIVAYDVDWHRELIEDRESGVLVGFREVEQLAKGVASVLNDSEWATRMGHRARADALQMMDPDRLNELERIQFRRILDGAADDPGVSTAVEV